MDLSGAPGPGLGVEITKQDIHAPYIYHFPDGNASIARLLVRALVPGSAPGNTMEDIVTAKMNDIDPQAWLADVLARIADHPAHNLEELMPWRWAAERRHRKLAA